jgi:N-methylhydantoinase A
MHGTRLSFADLIVEKRDRVAVITFNRPEKLNAFRDHTNFEMLEALDAIEEDESIHTLIITGNGKGFCTGHDMNDPAEPPAFRLGRNSRGRKYEQICERLLHFRQPIVAAINGWCAGGGIGFALCSDILIASEDAQFYNPQIAFGYPSLPGIGAMMLWYTSVAWTKELILARRKIDAATAERIGLVTRVVPPDRLMDEAWDVAKTMAEVPPDIMAMQREMMNRVWLAAGGTEVAMMAGHHTAIAGHSLPDWEENEANWKMMTRDTGGSNPTTNGGGHSVSLSSLPALPSIRGASGETYRLGVDVGGTFTDLILIGSESGDTFRAKVPSTPADPSVGVLDGIEQLCAAAGVERGNIGQIMHGTTVATNAILEGKGAKIGLVTTKGYRQTLQIGRSFVPGGLAAFIVWNMPEPLASLENTVEVEERIGTRGDIVEQLNEDSVRKGLRFLKEKGVEALTISLVNAYANGAHETRIREIAADIMPEIPVSVSSEILPEMYEYERTLTTVVNSYVAPVVSRYIGNLEDDFKKRGMNGNLHILRSDGGLATSQVAREAPVNLLMSGPAGGVAGALWIAKQAGYNNLLTFDMGGTSTDVALIQDGVPRVRRETTVGDVTVRASSLDVRSVGAGGGSIAHVPELTGALRVGPESAGADPGPAAYGKGGERPTVTDANVVLGRLPANLAGDMALDRAAAERSVQIVADALGLSVEQAASGMIDIVNENMFGALRLVSVEQGFDPRDFALIAFGGAGPLHANALGKLMSSWPVIIPPSPGVLCAYGDATTRLRNEASRTFIRRFFETNNGEVEGILGELGEQAAAVLDSEGVSRGEQSTEFEMDVRYHGQALSLPVKLDMATLRNGGLDSIRKDFDATHTQLFTFALDAEHEIVNLRAVVQGKSTTTRTAGIPEGTADASGAKTGMTTVYVDGARRDAAVYDRVLLQARNRIEGPAIVTEMDSTTWILPGHIAEVDAVGNIMINPA